MIEQYVDSLLPEISDDEQLEIKSQRTIKVRCLNEFPDVEQVIVASHPSSIAFSHLSILSSPVSLYDGQDLVGKAFIVDETGYVCLTKDCFFDVRDVFPSFDRIFVLACRQGRFEGVSFLSNHPDASVSTGLRQIDSAVSGMAAHIMTRSRLQRDKCMVLLQEHIPIRVSLESIMSLYEVLCKLPGFPPRDLESVRAEFKRKIPINSRVPLYT
jgi:hypothetical protein